MVNISKSGEEGYYPDLQKSAEDQLRSISPNNRHLRVPRSALTHHAFTPEQWSNIMSDVSNWRKEISVRDLKLSEENNNTVDKVDLPPIRRPALVKNSSDKSDKMKPSPRIIDYQMWDKYDADSEILKMELETEQERKMESEIKESQAETGSLEFIVKEAEKLSEVERSVLAEKAKIKGNEYYKAKEYGDAEKYYTASIAIWPTAKAYNNRSACYLMMCKYSAALEDANNTLALEPNNIKALFRRGVALQHKNKFREALADMAAVLRQEPKHLLAQHIARELREQVLTLPRPVRIMTDEGSGKPKRVLETDTQQLRHMSGFGFGKSYEVNEWGLPKLMCQCTGTPRFLQLASKSTRCFPNRNDLLSNYTMTNARISELYDESEPLRPKNSTKLKIIEVEKSSNELVEDFFRPRKYNVIDKRTHRLNSSLSMNNGAVNLTNCEMNVPDLINGDSSMDEDFETLSPLLDDDEPNV